MKAKLFTILALVLLPIAPASANDEGAWVKVDAQGNAISGPIVCTQDVCGNSQSLYNQLTLGVGERYVLQFKADPVTSNVAGIGNNTPNVDVRVNLETNEWTTTEITKYQVIAPESNKQLITKSDKVVTTWKSGADASERKTTVTPLTVEPKPQAVNANLNWQLLFSLGFEDLIKWLMQFYTGIVMP